MAIKIKPFVIKNGNKKFDVELTVKDVSFISNALNTLYKSNENYLTTVRKRYIKKLLGFFDRLLDE